MIAPASAERARWRMPGISRSLRFMAGAILILIVGVVAQQLRTLRSGVVANAERQMARLDMVFAEQTGRAMETVDVILRNAVDSELAAQRSGANPAIIDAMLQRRIADVRQISAIMIADASGRILCSTLQAGAAATLPAAGLTLLRHFATGKDEGWQISEPIRNAEGHWTALLARRLPAPDGGLGGIALASLNLQYFEDFYKSVELGDNGAIVLHRRGGTVLARYPHSESAIGTSFAGLSPFTQVLAHANAGTVLMTSPIDGRVRVLAIRALKLFPLTVSVSVDEARVLAPWRREAVTFMIAVLVVCGLIGALLLVLARQSARVERLLGEFKAAKEAAETANARLRVEMEERERAEAVLRQAQRIEAVGQLTGGVAHDFNNLLTVLLGNIDLLQKTVVLDPAAADRLGRMRTAAERGATLTDQLLAFSRRQPLAPCAVDIDGVLRGMTDLLRSAVGSNIVIDMQAATAPWPAMVDPTQIELVILNLAINARDAMPAGGLLTIATGTAQLGPPERSEDPPAGDYVVISVSDTGLGMTPTVLAKVFEPFFTTKAPGKGSGLGLSQVFGVARQSGGGVRIESTAGVGTTVRVFLPRAEEAAGTRGEGVPRPVAEAGDAAIVLLVDDDEAVRTTTAMILEGMGHIVRQAESGQQALDLLADRAEIDILLTDVTMPGMDGPELARRASLLRPFLPVVFLTGFTDPESVGGDVVGQRIVRKPFRAAELAEQIDLALAESHQSAASAG
jgi:signal transduction histidine kinase/CheY-like chemotaxis protein